MIISYRHYAKSPEFIFHKVLYPLTIIFPNYIYKIDSTPNLSLFSYLCDQILIVGEIWGPFLLELKVVGHSD